ncbi:F-box domain-containing protein [Pandoravirus kuranda]|uniref:F-box domain-containing protein n=1 Tax=Pandoravirus kuranda TaxID=3019033 RepID=A0AA95EDU1_9VIRU|nr:F-box domain-containing protein [Pandoravirus kuranda]
MATAPQPDASIHDWLPPELLRMILNGAATAAARPSWRVDHVPRRGRPFLDPRWRFAARAVCRLWHDVVTRPNGVEAAAIGRHPHNWPIAGHPAPPSACPKWPSGRVVCASVVADSIAAGRWDSAEAVYAWCAHEAGATRKQTAAAMVASGVTWVATAALEMAYSFGTRTPSITRVGVYSAPNTWAIGWDDDQGTLSAFVDVLWHVAITRASIATLESLMVRRGVSCLIGDALCAGGRGDEMAALAARGRPPSKVSWLHACAGPHHECFARLLDVAAAGLITPPPPAHTGEPSGRHESTWFALAMMDCRWRFLALLQARDMPFDIDAAFCAAAFARRLNTLQWLWAYATVRDPRRHRPDVPRAIRSALRGEKRPAKAVRVVSWLCLMCPRPVCPFSVEDASDADGHVLAQQSPLPLVLCLIEHWPRGLFESADHIVLVFRRCVAERDLGSLGRLLHLIDQRTRLAPCGDDLLEGLDLWDALATLCAQDSHFAFTPMLAAMRIAKALTDGYKPRAADVALFDASYNREIATPCRCVGHPLWRHDGDATASERRRVNDDQGPCYDERLLAALAPLRRWCRAKPVRASRVFPGWIPTPEASPLPAAEPERAIQDTLKQAVIEWLAGEGLLLPDDESED